MRLLCATLIILAGLAAAAQEGATPQARSDPHGQSVSAVRPVLANVPLVHLSARGEPVVTSEPIAPVYGSIRCDQSGGVYFSVAEDLRNPLSGPIVRLSRASRTAVKFNLHGVPDFAGKQLYFSRFALGSGGEVYIVATLTPSSENDAGAQYLVAFSQDGTYRWKTKLPRRFDTLRFVALPSGDFLVSGLELPPDRNSVKEPRKAFTVIMDADGNIKRQLTSKQEQQGYAVDLKVGTVSDPAITFADAELGPDGYIYMLNPGALPVVEVRSQAGNKIRELRLASPIEGAQASDLKIANGSLSILFQGPMEVDPIKGTKKRKVEIVTYNSLSGEPIRRYESRAIKGMLGCYEQDHFTFIVPNGANFSLVTADTQP